MAIIEHIRNCTKKIYWPSNLRIYDTIHTNTCIVFQFSDIIDISLVFTVDGNYVIHGLESLNVKPLTHLACRIQSLIEIFLEKWFLKIKYKINLKRLDEICNRFHMFVLRYLSFILIKTLHLHEPSLNFLNKVYVLNG